MDKRGQGISINVIIISAIALLVLVVLSVIFLNKFGFFASRSADCELQGGTCVVGACPSSLSPYTVWVCPPTGEGAPQTCCALPG